MELEGDNIPYVIGAFGTVTKGLLKGPGRFRSWWPSGDHPKNSIIENGQNTEKGPGDLRRLAVTQIPVKDHQLMLMWKTPMNNNNISGELENYVRQNSQAETLSKINTWLNHSLDIPGPFSSGPEMNLNKWNKGKEI